MSFINDAGYFKGKPLLLSADGQAPSWEAPCRFLLDLFQDPAGYGIPEQYYKDVRRIRVTFFPSMIARVLDEVVDDWAASKYDQERRSRILKLIPFHSLPRYEKSTAGAGPVVVTTIYHLVVRFHNADIQLFTAMDAIAYIFSIADPPEGIALTPETFFQPLLHALAQFLRLLHPSKDACPQVVCIVVRRSGEEMQWLLGSSLGRFKSGERYWDSELKSKLAAARWTEMSRFLGVDPGTVAPLVGTAGGHDWGHCAESLPFACLLRELDSKTETVWGTAVKWEDIENHPIHWGAAALKREEPVTVPPCYNCHRLLRLMNVESYSRFHTFQTSGRWR